jgi:hypothetical protein
MRIALRHSVGAGIFIAGLAIALACSPSTSPLDLAGVYALSSVNGQALPYVLESTPSTSVELLDDRFTLNPTGTYSEAGYKRITTNGAVSLTFPVDAGNFTRYGDQLTLESFLFSSRTGSIRNGTLTVIDQNLTLVYRK